MQLYWIPIVASIFALFVSGEPRLRRSSAIALTLAFLTLLSVSVVVAFYHGTNSDWQTYREFVEGCGSLGCTYFEPGFDLLTFISAETFGFATIKIILILSLAISIWLVVLRTTSSFVIIIAVVSITIASLPLMLGAIRQSLTLPLVLFSAFLLEQHRYRLALLSFAIAGTLHYSALVIAFYYGLVWFLLNPKWRSPHVLSSFLRVSVLILVGYAFLYLVFNSSIGEFYPLLSRIGQSGEGTDYIDTGGPIRNLMILGERLSFGIASVFLLGKQRHSLSPTERIFLLMYIAGTAFFISTFIFDRTIAGRTLATFRLADVLVVVIVANYFFGAHRSRIATLSALVFGVLFVVTKSYMTLASVGFFNE
jgi:hypothetical protein